MGRGLGLIVGAGPGLGLALARALAAEGFDLALVTREGESPAPFVEALGGFPVTHWIFPCDAGNGPDLAEVLKGLTGGSPVEILVYNASRATPGPPSSLDPAALLADLEVHLGGALRSVQAVLPGMRGRGRGTILFTGGGSALHPKIPEAGLAVGKGALRTLAFLLAEELEPAGIHVATVTIDGFIKAGTTLDPDRIARKFLELHGEVRGFWTHERILSRGENTN